MSSGLTDCTEDFKKWPARKEAPVSSDILDEALANCYLQDGALVKCDIQDEALVNSYL